MHDHFKPASSRIVAAAREWLNKLHKKDRRPGQPDPAIDENRARQP